MPDSRADACANAESLAARTEYQLAVAATCLRNGGAIAHATEGVWGLACLASAEDAIWRILAIKRRSWRKGLILVADKPARFADLLTALPVDAQNRLMGAWPGPITWLVPHRGLVHRVICGDSERVALRVTDHAQFAALCRRVGEPLVSTSANRGSAPPVLSAQAARLVFGGEIDFVLSGELGSAGGPSAIIDALSGEQLRAGARTARR